MVSETRAAHGIEITAESLQEDLARLRIQKQALERELAAVVAHLGSVQRALSAFETLMPVAERGRAAAPVAPQRETASSTSADAAAPSAPPTHHPESGEAAERVRAAGADTDGQKKYGMLTEQIMEYFATVGDADVRARDVAAALGRDADSGSINGVRSTLDRLVGTSRIQRAGRGLYRARRS